MEPKISIIIIGYKEPEIFKKCFQSIIDNTNYPNYEIIFLSNNAEKEIQKYIVDEIINLKKCDIKAIFLDENIGVSRGYNKAVQRHATGKYLCLINSDYIMTQNWLTKLKKCFEHKEGIGLVGCMTDVTGNKKEQVTHQGNIPVVTGRWMNTGLTISMYFTTRKIYDEVSGWDPYYKQGFCDLDFNEKILQAGYEIWVDGKNFCHHNHDCRIKAKDGREKDFVESRIYFRQKWGEKVANKYEWA